MIQEEIIQKLPYSKPFLFVDDVLMINEDEIKGCYTFTEDEYFYKGHFKDNPITPGVILTECMAQIGLACFGIYLLKEEWSEEAWGIAMTETNVQFFKPVFPGETVTVIARKEYFRFNKLKCKVRMLDHSNKTIVKGVISGIAFKK